MSDLYPFPASSTRRGHCLSWSAVLVRLVDDGIHPSAVCDRRGAPDRA